MLKPNHLEVEHFFRLQLPFTQLMAILQNSIQFSLADDKILRGWLHHNDSSICTQALL
jgi:hypothetical protein